MSDLCTILSHLLAVVRNPKCGLGDATPESVCRLASFVREKWDGKIKTAWYSGCKALNDKAYSNYFNFIKLGPYIESLGGLDKKTTNQRLYKIEQGFMTDITARMITDDY